MELVDVRYIGSNDQYQTYSPQDIALINTNTIIGKYGAPNDYIEYFIKDLGNTVIDANYYVTEYQLDNAVVDPITRTTTQLYLDPERDARLLGYNRGIVNIKYNFFSKQLASAPSLSQNFWIKEISTSRTEIKAARQDLSNGDLQLAFSEFNAVLAADAYYPTFYLNFGADIQIIGINAVYVEEDGNGYIIFKLYEPLPIEYDLKSTFWVVTQVADSAEFNVSINVAPETILDSLPIKGPNFKVNIKEKVGQTTPYYSYESLLLTSVTSSFQQLKSMMDEKGIQINVDYSNFSNFIHFSSATERLYNFIYKVQLIESASAGLAQNNTSTAKVLLQNQIDTTITNFDGYEYYLYFTSASTAWPKQNSTQPYLLYPVTSSQVITWLGNINTVPTATTMSMYWSSSYYDDQNKDLLLYATPSYILDDSANAPYLLFLNMIGQHFDNIWIYLKDVTNHYSAENNPFVGISMDQVADALRSFGVQLYTNTSITDNIYYSLLGLNQTGSALPVTSSAYSVVNIASSSLYPLSGSAYLSSSLALPPFGEEKINRYVTTFVTQSSPAFDISQSFATLPASQLQGEIYKRLYHNLAYLLKTRGTERGIKALVTTFGIPGNILDPHEYGGYNIYQVPGIQEISNTKIITGSVLNISSSLLSPYTTIQYYQNDQDKTSNTVEVGFSPADSINASITSSGLVTSSTQPGYFNIMQLIGAPNLQYSSSYIPLVELANTYFSAEYTSKYNVWDFIRVIKYYNNSVFKMLRDWMPARASATTGIAIQSHMLERNKYPRHEPTYTILSGSAQIKMVTVSGSDGGAIKKNTYYVEAIPVQYQSNSVYLGNASGTVYMSSSNNIQKYTGEFSGSNIVTAYASFPQEEVSSYIYPWTSSVATSTAGGNIMFLTYSLSPTLNNITGAVLSQRFLDLDYNSDQVTPVNYGLITQSLARSLVIGNISQSMQPYSQYAQLQDYNYNLPSIVSIRYSGSYLSGTGYNTWSVGDISYGTDPVINYYSNKLGLFTQIQSSSFIPGAVNASLGYLADVSGGLFELNQNNRNWVDLQNIFVAGTNLTIKQFDNKKYSNQVATDGIKTIYNSGYNYTPQLYFQTGVDNTLFFQYTGDSSITSFIASLTGTPNYNISGVPSPTYPVTDTINIYKVFNYANPTTYFSVGNTTNFPSYSAPQGGQREFTVNLGVSFSFTDPSVSLTSGSYDFGAYLNGTNLIGNVQSVNFTSSYTAATTGTGSINSPGTANVDSGFNYNYQTNYGTFTGPFLLNGNPTVLGDSGSVLVVDIYTWMQGGVNITAPLVTSNTGATVTGVYPEDTSATPTRIQQISSAAAVPASSVASAIKTISYTTPPYSVGVNQPVVFKFTQGGMSSANYTASLTSNSSLTVGTIAVGAGGYPYATTSSGNFISSFANLTGSYSSITLSSNLAQYAGYQFVPYFVSASVTYSSSLYTKYGDVNINFSPQNGDKVILIDNAGITQDLDVYSFSDPTITVVGDILSNWVINPSLVKTFLLLRKYNDEQNVILTFTKPSGATSYGFIIPETISPQVVDNINTLQANVQAQLLSTQTSANISTL